VRSRVATSLAVCTVLLCMAVWPARAGGIEVRYFPVPTGSHPHDVAPAPDGFVWFTAQHTGQLGRLDPRTGRSELVPLGRGSAPHGVIVGHDGAAWVTDGGQNAIARVDPATLSVDLYPLPKGTPYANLNTLAMDRDGTLWFTGQEGWYGSVVPASRQVRVWPSPRGRGPYGIAVTPSGEVWYASLAGNYIARIDRATGAVDVVDPPTPGQGARRIWADSRGRLWVSEWNSGDLSVYESTAGRWSRYRPPGDHPHTYSVCVDARCRGRSA